MRLKRSLIYGSYFDFKEKNFLNESRIKQADLLFNAVAPIAVYFFADIAFKKQAEKGFKDLQNNLLGDSVQDLIVDEMKHEDSLSVDDLDAAKIKDIYNELFAWAVENRTPDNVDCKFMIDNYGGYNYEYDEEIVFGSNDSYCFPWYENTHAIEERIDIQSEVRPR